MESGVSEDAVNGHIQVSLEENENDMPWLSEWCMDVCIYVWGECEKKCTSNGLLVLICNFAPASSSSLEEQRVLSVFPRLLWLQTST